MNRWHDWWQQALRDLAHGEHSVEGEDYEWAAFAAHQAAEKAIKALIMKLGGEPWGHSVASLLEALPEEVEVALAPEAVEASRRIDKHYIPTRYPNGLPGGHPGELYTRKEAQDALVDARAVLDFCRRQVSG